MAETIKLKKFVQYSVDGNTKYVGQFVDPAQEVTKTYFEQQLTALREQITAGNIWKKSVDNFASIATTYPSPAEGWTVSVNDTNIIYRYDAATSTWIDIAQNSNSLATTSKNGLMSKEMFTKLNSLQNYVHPTSHPADMIVETQTKQFVSQSEKNTWNSLQTFPGYGGLGSNFGTLGTAARTDHTHYELLALQRILYNGAFNLQESNGYTITSSNVGIHFNVGSNQRLSIRTDGTITGGSNSSRRLMFVDDNLPVAQISNLGTGWTGLLSSAVQDWNKRWPNWSEIGSKPSTFTPSNHNHILSELTGLNVGWHSLLNSAPATFNTRHTNWEEIGNRPSAFQPVPHDHRELYNSIQPQPHNTNHEAHIKYALLNETDYFSDNDTRHPTKTGRDAKKMLFQMLGGKNSVNPNTGTNWNHNNLMIFNDGRTILKAFNTSTNQWLPAFVFSFLNVPQQWTAYQDFKSGAGNTGSDMRFKQEVKTIPNILQTLLSLEIIEYKWCKVGEERETFGVNANQLLESTEHLLKTMVHEREDEDKTKWVEYDRFGVLAIKGLQELNQTLQEENRELKERIEQLEKKFEMLVELL